ncbi:hypothetical protein CAPTEDRAFT_185193 [Capitella teleta]|uniref:Glycosyltransferase 61 catalytic domain-containing protein n=1 Tax=Capitella teleta TaxID=283909 RepID=R7U155_CAPTE|nr:hypothetical protein CAPTEDRAFT_185193 [Capitella teleta]|eukprot:ELT97366.1 hypothetical protein CAPTEDRAFT_185193 [Capitella teleta]
MIERRQVASKKWFFTATPFTALIVTAGVFFVLGCVADLEYVARVSRMQVYFKTAMVSSTSNTSGTRAYNGHAEEIDEEEAGDGTSSHNQRNERGFPEIRSLEREELEDDASIRRASAGKQDNMAAIVSRDQLGKVNTFLFPYLEQMQIIRKRLLTSHFSYPNLTEKMITHLFGYSEDLFDRARRHPQIDLIQIKCDFTEAQKLLLPNYYDITATDCSGLTGVARSMEDFNTTCFSHIKDTLQPKTLATKRQAFVRGLPRIDNIDLDNLTLTYIMIIPKVFISSHGDVLLNGMRIIPRRCKEGNLRDYSRGDLPVDSIQEYEEVFSAHHTYGEAVYHSTVESLQRLVPYLSFLKANPSIKILLGSKHAFLPLLGLDIDRVIVHRMVRAKVAYLPAGVGCCTSPIFTTQLLARNLRSRFNTNKQDTVVLIRRSKQKGRYFRHHGGILRMLQADVAPLGMKIDVYGDNPLPSLAETRRVFHQAAVVISPHGAGASNLLFSQPGTLLIEGLHSPFRTRPNLCFLVMSQALGLRYHGIYINDSVTEIRAEDIKRPILSFLSMVYKKT